MESTETRHHTLHPLRDNYYYDKTCDSHGLFEQYQIAQDPGFEDHLGKYDVIYLDMTGIKPYQDEGTYLRDRVSPEGDGVVSAFNRCYCMR